MGNVTKVGVVVGIPVDLERLIHEMGGGKMVGGFR